MTIEEETKRETARERELFLALETTTALPPEEKADAVVAIFTGDELSVLAVLRDNSELPDEDRDDLLASLFGA